STPAASDGGAPKPGERFGPCYPNGTCNETLTCTDGICLRPSDPIPDSGLSADAAEGGSDAGGTDATAWQCPGKVPLATPSVSCPPQACGNSEICCLQQPPSCVTDPVACPQAVWA